MTKLIVRCINIENNWHLTEGKEYAVSRETLSTYKVYNDEGDCVLYPKRLFEVVPSVERHPHAEQIIAWAEGAIIQYSFSAGTSNFKDCDDNHPRWFAHYKYRVKPIEVVNPNTDKIIALEKSIADATRALAVAKENLNKLK